MNRFVRRVALALIVASPLGAAAQDVVEPRPVPKPFRIGVGGSFELTNILVLDIDGNETLANGFVPTSFTDVTIPMWIGEHIRIEPHVGWLESGGERRTTFEGELLDQEEASISAFRIGTGVAWAWDVAERTKVYVGPRFGLVFNTREEEEFERIPPDLEGARTTRTTTSTDFWIGAAVGGEAFLTEAFSLGLEAQLNYVSFGEPDVDVDVDPEPEPQPEPEPGPVTDRDSGLWTTRLAIFARVYFL